MICQGVDATKLPLYVFPAFVSNPIVTQLELSVKSSKEGQNCEFDLSLRELSIKWSLAHRMLESRILKVE